jgi:hypothetical protein
MTLREYQVLQLGLFALYLFGCPGLLVVPAMYGLFFYNMRRIDQWMRNRDARGRYARGSGPISS